METGKSNELNRNNLNIQTTKEWEREPEELTDMELEDVSGGTSLVDSLCGHTLQSPNSADQDNNTQGQK
jgi:hypothetical protein